MKTVVIDGVEYEEVKREGSFLEGWIIAFQPLPPKRKTIVQVAADVHEYKEDEYRKLYLSSTAVYDYIEQRLQAIEKKLEEK
jgi:hypothetical protein